MRDNKTKKSPYHDVRVTKGVYGELSKIQEELDEAVDADIRGLDLLVLIELADVIGAVAGVAEEQYGFDLDQLIAFSEMVRGVKSKEAAQAQENLEQAKQSLEAAKASRRELEGGWEVICRRIWDNPSIPMAAKIGRMQDRYLNHPEELPLKILEPGDEPMICDVFEKQGWKFDLDEDFNRGEREMINHFGGLRAFAALLTEKFTEQAEQYGRKPKGLAGEMIGENGKSSGPVFNPKQYGTDE